ELDEPVLVPHGQQCPLHLYFITHDSLASLSMTSGNSRRSTSLMRSWSVASVSPSSTGTASCARIGPASTSSVTRCTGVPVTLTPKSSASRTACQPLNAGSSAGCVFTARPPYASTNGFERMVPKPATATNSTSCFFSASTTSWVAANRSNDCVKSGRSTFSTGTPAVAAISV